MSKKLSQRNNVIEFIKDKLRRKKMRRKTYNFSGSGYYSTYYNAPGKPVWSSRNYIKFSDEGFIRNVIAHRAINMIASGAASIPLKVHGKNDRVRKSDIEKIQKLLTHPNPCVGSSEFFEAVYSYKLIHGNSYVQAVKSSDGMVHELFLLRPDRVTIIAGKSCLPEAYRYIVGDKAKDFKVDRLTGKSDILHLKNFHPLNDWYGLSSIEAAAYSIDQHNQACQWNQALLQNGARPSGALVVQGTKNEAGYLSEEQYMRIKNQMQDMHVGAANAGKPLLLEGGLEWKEMSLSPKDMDFLNIKNSSARDIALAFGVPAQLLGIEGDSTYNNMEQARLALWEQTIIPLLENTVAALNNWLVPMFGNGFVISYDKNAINALIPRRDALWKNVADASFLSDQEKRDILGV